MGEQKTVNRFERPSEETTETLGRRLVAWLMLSFPIDAFALSILGLIPGIALLTMNPIWAGISALGGLIFGAINAYNERRTKTVRNSAQVILSGLLLFLPAIVAAGLYLTQAYIITGMLFSAPGYSIVYLYNIHRDEVAKSKSASMKLDGLTELRERYIQGEITEDQFEQRLDELLDTDTPETASPSVESQEKIRE